MNLSQSRIRNLNICSSSNRFKKRNSIDKPINCFKSEDIEKGRFKKETHHTHMKSANDEKSYDQQVLEGLNLCKSPLFKKNMHYN
jgi:hypothetical protein